ncbi:MAG: enoyl-CoA hydratase [Alphaproteobacteria bacterium]|jgi:enoyl-CoA hydratase/carnithine racemase|nr:enoyl-CoA hydratase [Alphaproteobacteria bacterium]MBT7943518.1 enoyl-CoA hydratase [Alphaproteobacteria bacterium]
MNATTDALKNESILLREDRDGIATLTLNRPEKYNALSTELMGLIQDQLDLLANDTSIRVVIIAANGKAFCAGHDLREMDADPSEEAIGALFEQCSAMMVSLTRLPQPVIAHVHGMATAAGCQLVAQCDLAVAADDVRFATSGINVGLFCGTPMVAVTRNLPRKQAMEMLLTGDFIDAATAERYGLINRAVPAGDLDKAVQDLAQSVAKQGPAFIAAGKNLFYRQIEDGLSGAYEEASKTMVDNMQREDAREGIKAFVEKRDMPEWQDR